MSVGMSARRWLVALLCIGAIVATAELGFWQVRRGAGKELLQQRLVAAGAAAPAVPDASVADDPARFVYRPLRFTGWWRPDAAVYLDNRPQDGRVGFYVLMPLHVSAPFETDVIVNRGWIARDPRDRARIAPYVTPEGNVTVVGVALPEEPRLLELGREPARRLGTIWQNFDFDDFARASGRRPLRLVLRENRSAAGEPSDGLVRDWPESGGPLQAQIDRHHGYAFQWFALSLTLAALLLHQIIKRVRHDRRASA